jgi:hypothetical protein
MQQGFSRLYQWHLLKAPRRAVRAKTERYASGQIHWDALNDYNSFWGIRL